MARFDWFVFLRQHRIHHTTVGPNASRGRVNIKCPLCGKNDPSEHMGLNLSNEGWSCWRNASHRGRARWKIIQIMLGCSREEAETLAYGETVLPGRGAVSDELRGMLRPKTMTEKPPDKIAFPKSFKLLAEPDRYGDQFWDYMVARGYREPHIDWLAKAYGLRYTVRGDFAYRLIIPITDRYGKLMSWTGRSINPKEEKRYDTIRVWRPNLKEPERGFGLAPSNSLLLGLPLLWGCESPKALIVCEGPFDAFKVSVIGRGIGVYGTCLFGLTFTEEQQALVADLATRFRVRRLIIDSAEALQGLRIASKAPGLVPMKMPGKAKDLDDLKPTEIFSMCWKLIQ